MFFRQTFFVRKLLSIVSLFPQFLPITVHLEVPRPALSCPASDYPSRPLFTWVSTLCRPQSSNSNNSDNRDNKDKSDNSENSGVHSDNSENGDNRDNSNNSDHSDNSDNSGNSNNSDNRDNSDNR